MVYRVSPKKVPFVVNVRSYTFGNLLNKQQYKHAKLQINFVLPPVRVRMVQQTTRQRVFVAEKETVYLCEIVLLFAVLCYLADWEVIIIPPFAQLRCHNARSKQKV